MPRPTMKTLMIITSSFMAIGCIVGIGLALRLYYSIFWSLFDGKYADLDIRLYVFWTIIAVSSTGILLWLNTFPLLNDPQCFYRFFSAVFSFLCAGVLLTVSIIALFEVIKAPADLSLLCIGGFPSFGLISYSYFY